MKVFPETWKILPANEVCSEIVDCLNKTAPVVERDTGYRMIRTTNVRNGVVDVGETKFVEEVVFRKWTRRARPRFGDIILTREAPLGEVGILRSDANVFLGQRTILYRADPKKLDQRFLYYQMSGPYVKAVIQTKGSGATVEHLRVPDAESLPIPVAPLNVQKKIAAILSAYDQLIETNRRRIALLERVVEEIYREWFVRRRFPGHERAKFARARPASWVTVRLGEVANLTMGQSPPSTTYNELGNGLPFHQGVGTYGDRFPKKVVFCTANGRRARKGDILFSVRAPVGRLNIADSEMIIGRGLASLRHKKGYNSYLYCSLKAAFANEDIIGNGSIFNSVGRDELARFEILQPDGQLIKSFENQAATIDEQIANLTLSVEHLAKARDLLLPRLISGKFSVEKLDIQFPPGMMEDLDQSSNLTHHA